MNVAVLLLALIAYGDTPDYFPASTPSDGMNTSDQGSIAGRPADRSAPSVRDRARFAPPQNQSSDRFRQPPSFGTVHPARFEMDANWPNRASDGDGQSKNLAAKDPSSLSGQRPPSLSGTNESQAGRATETFQPAGPAATTRGNRYIPANAQTSESLGTLSSSQPPTGSDTGDQSPSGVRYVRDGRPAVAAAVPPLKPRDNGDLTARADLRDQGQSGSPFDMDVSERLGPASPAPRTTVGRQAAASDRQDSFPYHQDVPPPQSMRPQSSTGASYPPPGELNAPGGLVNTGAGKLSGPSTTDADWARLAQQTNDATRKTAAVVVDAAGTALPSSLSASSPLPTKTIPNDVHRFPAEGGNPSSLGPQRVTPGGSFMTTMLALFGSIGLNLYLGWVAWDTYNRYQDLVHDVRYTGSRRESQRDEYGERVGDAAY